MKMDALHTYAAAIVRALDDELIVEQSDENSYDYAENRVRLNLRDFEDCGFMRHLREVHNCRWADEFSVMLWTILHEVGHAETEDDYDDDEYEECLKAKALVAMIPVEVAKDRPDLQDIYFNTCEEWCATEWAIDYIKSHKRQCRKWSAELESRK